MGKTVLTVVGVVAAVAIAIAAPYLAPLALGVIGVTATATTIAIATAVIGLTLSVALAIGMRAIVGGAPVAKSPVGPPSVFRQSITDSFIVYGKRRVGGLLVFFHARQSGDDHFRYFVIACAGHRCQGAVSFMLGDEVVTVDGSNMVTSGKYANAAWIWFQRGTTTDSAPSTFTTQTDGRWTSAHQGKGIAKIFAVFQMTDEVVQAGMPNITAIIEGRDEVYNPGGAVGYTRNAARIFYDWMKITREEGGFGAYSDEIPSTAFITAQANVCDEVVNSQPRYAIDAVITTGAAPSEVRDVLIANMAGSYSYVGGKHLMRPGYWVPVSATLSEDDLAGPIQVSPFMAADRAANEVRGTYVEPADGYQAREFATQTITPAPSDVRQLGVDFAFTTNKHQAERIAAIMLNRAQHEKTVLWPMNIMGLSVQALDTVQVDSARYGLSNYAWRIGSWGLSSDYGVIVNLVEESEDIYDEPTPVSPPSVPDIVQPTAPVQSIGELQAILRATYPTGLVLTSAESGGVASVTFDAFTLQYPAPYGATNISGPSTINGLVPSTLYYAFVDVDEAGDSTPTRGVTTDYADALNSNANPKRIFLNQAVTTPASGSGGSGSGTGAGGGYGGGTQIP